MRHHGWSTRGRRCAWHLLRRLLSRNAQQRPRPSCFDFGCFCLGRFAPGHFCPRALSSGCSFLRFGFAAHSSLDRLRASRCRCDHSSVSSPGILLEPCRHVHFAALRPEAPRIGSRRTPPSADSGGLKEFLNGGRAQPWPRFEVRRSLASPGAVLFPARCSDHGNGYTGSRAGGRIDGSLKLESRLHGHRNLEHRTRD